MTRAAKVRSPKITQAARGADCTLRLPGICTFNPETVVFAHAPGGGKGMATKVSDLHGAFACSACHDAADRRNAGVDEADLLRAWLRAIEETQGQLAERGVIVVPGAKLI